jgi:hypothetical protein
MTEGNRPPVGEFALEEAKMLVARTESDDIEQIEKSLRNVSETRGDVKDDLNNLEQFFALSDEPVYGNSSPHGRNEHIDTERAFRSGPREKPAGALKTPAASAPDSPVPVTVSPAPFITPSLPSDGRAGVTAAPDPRVLRPSGPQPRPLMRRIAERLVLGVATLALLGGWVWMAGQAPFTRNALLLRGTNASAETVAALDAAITNPASKSLMPAWFSSEILYSPTMAFSATAGTRPPAPPRR